MSDETTTPRPWIYKADVGLILSTTARAATSGRPVLVASVDNPADARLIAAAPEMLALLRHLAGGRGIWNGALVKATTALLARIDGGT